MKQVKLSSLLFGLLLISSLIIPSLAYGQMPTTASTKTIEINPNQIVETKICPAGCTCLGDTISCPVESNCQAPCIMSGDTCTCPPKKTPTCKVGCICNGDVMTCPVEPLKTCTACADGIPTGQKDSNGCPVYSCPLKQCPVGCICSDDVVTCPVEPSCQAPCIKSGNTCTCPVEQSKTCPVGCTCSGNVTACPTEGVKPIEAKISTPFGIETISVEKTPNGLSLKSDKATAITTGNLIIEQDTLSFKTSNGNKEIKILPEETLSKVANATQVGTIELREESQQPIYSVKGMTQTKLLFVIPVSMKIETKISAETGNVISVSKPWWSFLAW